MSLNSLVSKLLELKIRKGGLVRRDVSLSLLLSLELLRVDLTSLELLGDELLLFDHRISSVALKFDSSRLNISNSILVNELLEVS